MNLTEIKLHKKEEGFVSRDQVEWLIREIERLTQQVGLEARTIDSIILKTQEKTSAASAEELGQLRDELKEARKQVWLEAAEIAEEHEIKQDDGGSDAIRRKAEEL